jgi:hypothetical protein
VDVGWGTGLALNKIMVTGWVGVANKGWMHVGVGKMHCRVGSGSRASGAEYGCPNHGVFFPVPLG